MLFRSKDEVNNLINRFYFLNLSSLIVSNYTKWTSSLYLAGRMLIMTFIFSFYFALGYYWRLNQLHGVLKFEKEIQVFY